MRPAQRPMLALKSKQALLLPKQHQRHRWLPPSPLCVGNHQLRKPADRSQAVGQLPRVVPSRSSHAEAPVRQAAVHLGRSDEVQAIATRDGTVGVQLDRELDLGQAAAVAT